MACSSKSMTTAADQCPRPSHHVEGGTFTNPWPTWPGDKSLGDVWRWHSDRRKAGFPSNTAPGILIGNNKPTPEDFKRAFPLNPVDYDALAAPPPDEVQAVWVGHATVLVQMEGLTFITDPVFSARASPFQFLGPKRNVAPALDASSPRLPVLDFVLISHNHYDHLDTASVKALNKRYGDALTWYVPLGIKVFMESCGVKSAIEMDWWQEIMHKDTKVAVCMVPAQHWSSRRITDRRATLWGGYVVKGPSRKFYFAGDTAYCPVFTEIGDKYGPIDLAAIPIGAYAPRDFMSPQHCDPAEGLQIHKDVKALRSLSIHCCTFSLTDEPNDEPPAVMTKLLSEQGLDPDLFMTVQHGEMMRVGAGGQMLNTPKRLGV